MGYGSTTKGGGKLPPEDRKIRDELILLKRLSGVKLSEIQAEFNVGRTTVIESVRRARNGRIGTIAQDMVLNRLLPRAIAVMEAEMENGGERAVDVAFKVVDATQIMTPIAPSGTKVVEEFEAFRRRVTTTVGGAPQEESPLEDIDGEVVHEHSRSEVVPLINPLLCHTGPGGTDRADEGSEGGGGALFVGGDLPGSSADSGPEGDYPRGCGVEDAAGAAQIHLPGLGDKRDTPLEVTPTQEGLILAEAREKVLYPKGKKGGPKPKPNLPEIDWGQNG